MYNITVRVSGVKNANEIANSIAILMQRLTGKKCNVNLQDNTRAKQITQTKQLEQRKALMHKK